jgi:leader peptidase (prepilin peptidase)/N-methyltransferase
MLMIVVILLVYGICLGSFVNALVWRIHAQSTESGKKNPNKKRLQRLSISKGRSMCPDCSHELGSKDLIPVLSWVSLGGKCRYCSKPISAQYPLVELTTAVLFLISYIYWPQPLHGLQIAIFVLWLALLTGFMALVVYDLRWMLLPNRLVFPLTALAFVQAVLRIAASSHHVHALIQTLLSVVIGGGLFYVLFQISAGKWIGGGDVKLGWLLGLSIGTPSGSLLFIFLAALLGCAVSVPLMVTGRLKKSTIIPFGPFLIAGTIITQLFGASITQWYSHHLLGL